jgi:hypothetical protein
MKTASRYLLLALTALSAVACGSAVTSVKLQQITDGMKTDQVVALLGQPTRIQHAEITGVTGDAYLYDSTKGEAVVVFVNGAVFRTNYIHGDKFL